MTPSKRPGAKAYGRSAPLPFRLRGGACLLLPFLVCLNLSARPASAQTLRALSFSSDNDGFVFWVPPHDRADRYYTNGFRADAWVAWSVPWEGLLAADGLEYCGAGSSEDPCLLTRIGLGQQIYTPAFIFDEDPSLHDRPYAGWLYLEVGTAKLEPGGSTSLALQLGVTGEPSLAGPVHRWFHRALKKHEPLGWDHQIPFEPAFLVRLHHRQNLPLVSGHAAPYVALQPELGVSVGTLRTGATLGLFMQAGWNVASSPDWPQAPGPSPYLLVGAGAETELVLRDLFLDGSTWNPGLRANHEPLVGRLRARVVLGWRRLALEFGATGSTLEFQGQDGGHTYGTVRLIVHMGSPHRDAGSEPEATGMEGG